MAYDIFIGFTGEDGSNTFTDSGSNQFTVTQGSGSDVVLTTSDPRLEPTSGLFQGAEYLVIGNGFNSLETNDFRIEVWFKSDDLEEAQVVFECPDDLRVYYDGSGLVFRSDAGGYISPGVDLGTSIWYRVIISRHTESGRQITTCILNENVWFSREDSTNYNNGGNISLGSRPSGSGYLVGQMARFQLERLGVGATQSAPPRISVTLSEGTTQQVLNKHFTGEDPRLLRSPYSPTISSIGDWDLVSGFSAGFQIPRVRVRCDNYAQLQHMRNVPIGSTSSYTNVSPRIWLDWEGGLQSQEWLNYDPHYFLFYRSTRKQRKWSATPRDNGAWGRTTTYVHPANYVDGVNVSMVTNMGGGDAVFSTYLSNSRASEWRVPPKRFTKIDISDPNDVSNPFDAWQYYRSLALLSFPIPYDDWYTYVRPIGQKGTENNGGSNVSHRSKGCLNLRFCIAVRDPLNPQRIVFGPMSERVMIYPMKGFFDDGVDPDIPYYYRWGVTIKS